MRATDDGSPSRSSVASVSVHTLHKQHVLKRMSGVDHVMAELRESLAPGEEVVRLNPPVLDKGQLMFVVTGNFFTFTYWLAGFTVIRYGLSENNLTEINVFTSIQHEISDKKKACQFVKHGHSLYLDTLQLYPDWLSASLPHPFFECCPSIPTSLPTLTVPIPHQDLPGINSLPPSQACMERIKSFM